MRTKIDYCIHNNKNQKKKTVLISDSRRYYNMGLIDGIGGIDWCVF